MAKATPITDATFNDEIGTSEVPVVVDFWATWCPPCRMIAPVLDQIATEYDGKLKVTKLDVDSNPNTAMLFGVQSLPTQIVFKGGKAVERIVGYMPKNRLVERIQPHLS